MRDQLKNFSGSKFKLSGRLIEKNPGCNSQAAWSFARASRRPSRRVNSIAKIGTNPSHHHNLHYDRQLLKQTNDRKISSSKDSISKYRIDRSGSKSLRLWFGFRIQVFGVSITEPFQA